MSGEVIADLNGQTAVVVGGSSGIGRAAALRFAQSGAHVFVAGRSPERVDGVCREITGEGGQATGVPLDVRDHAALKSLVEKAVADTGTLNIMVNAAGIEYVGTLIDGEPELWREMYEVNVLSTLVGAQEAIRVMRKGDFSGHIILIGSVAGRSEKTGVYGSTKAAIHSLASSLRAELEDDPIRLVNVIPGVIMTNFVRTFPDEMMNEFLENFGMDPNFRQGDLLSEKQITEIHERASAIVASADDVARAVLFAVSQPVGVNVYEVFVRPPKDLS